jgi:hypothetical protein
MKTIVSVTPLPVERDSRTFKEASVYSRLGYRSIVLERHPSGGLPAELPFELQALDGSPAPPREPSAAAADVPQGAVAGASSAGPPMGRLDAFAASAPPWLRAIAGPPWRRILRYGSPRKLIPRGDSAGGRIGEILAFGWLVATYVRTCSATASALPPADLYHLHSQHQLPAVWWRCRRDGVPFIYDAHDLYATMRINAGPMAPADRAMWRVWDVVERLAARLATACVTVGDGVAAHAETQFGRPFAVVRNAHDERLDEHVPTDIRSAAGLGESALVIAVVGNHKPAIIAIEPLIEALAHLPAHVHLVCIGRGYDEVSGRAAENGVGGRVHTLAPVRPTQIVPFLRGADLVPILYHPVNADIRNALPNKFFQAVGAAVPILYGRHQTDVGRLCRDHALGWEIDPENVASLVTTIARLDADRDALKRCRVRIMAARDSLSWAAEEPKLRAVVEQALKGRLR